MHVHDGDTLVGKSIGELDFKVNKLLFIGLEREGEFLFNPPAAEVIQSYDILLLMGREISLEYFRNRHGGRV